MADTLGYKYIIPKNDNCQEHYMLPFKKGYILNKPAMNIIFLMGKLQDHLMAPMGVSLVRNRLFGAAC